MMALLCLNVGIKAFFYLEDQQQKTCTLKQPGALEYPDRPSLGI